MQLRNTFSIPRDRCVASFTSALLTSITSLTLLWWFDSHVFRARINFPRTFLLYQRPRSQAAPPVERENNRKKKYIHTENIKLVG